MPSLPPAWIWPRAAYVHVPFCAHHCGYCDFAVAVGQDALIDRYIDALAAELATLERPQAVTTLFLGGGTPTHLDARRLDRLLEEIGRWLPLAADGEFSVEANPDTIDDDRIAVLASHGVNRVSIGAQSFQPRLLQVLERRHQASEVPHAVERLRGRIKRVSLDLIFGIPEQTIEDWRADLQQALDLGVEHLSTYGLTYEKGTRLWKQKQHLQIRPLAEEAELALYVHAMDTLEDAGFEQYEISSFARPGGRCRHNEAYWANDAYFGFGVGAARYVNGRRELNSRDLQTYLRRVLAGKPATFQCETLAPEQQARETIAVQLRRAEGIVRPAFRKRTGYELDALAGDAVQRHVALGLLEDDGPSVRLTRRGRCVADSVVEGML